MKPLTKKTRRSFNEFSKKIQSCYNGPRMFPEIMLPSFTFNPNKMLFIDRGGYVGESTTDLLLSNSMIIRRERDGVIGAVTIDTEFSGKRVIRVA